ncbi:MAG: GNAT family acetyltransferase [Anaerolineales bacterium]|nr:GNAT family acetyltransferase [Anaerolineales bacterium]
MQIREFQMTDYDAVIGLWQITDIPLGRTDDQAGVIHKMERDPDLFLVGIENDVLVGAVMGTYDGRRGWINHLAIHPNYQGRGYGAAIVAQLEERLRKKGCQKLNLLIEPKNAKVQHFYETLDYQREELIFMEKWLT